MDESKPDNRDATDDPPGDDLLSGEETLAEPPVTDADSSTDAKPEPPERQWASFTPSPSPPESKYESQNFARFRRAFYFLGGVVAPILCFFAAMEEGGSLNAGDLWQDGSLETYCSLLSAWPAAAPFYPLLIYCMVSLTLILWDQDRFSRFVSVRFGVYSGVLLSFQYFFVVFSPSANPFDFLARFCILAGISFIATLFHVGIALLFFALGWKRSFLLITFLATIATLISALSDYQHSHSLQHAFTEAVPETLLTPLAFLFISCLALGNSWCIAIYSTYSWILWRGRRNASRQFSLKQLFALMTWVAAYFAAWRLSVNMMLVEYAKLPTEDPSCYVCTAAARGHRRFVGSVSIPTHHGPTLAVNDQMRWLKAAELVLRRTLPSGHRLLRRLYNAIGPRAARYITRPLAADLAYLLLLPAEWAARIVLTLLLPKRGRVVRRLYRR